MYSADQDELLRYIDLKLAALGQPTSAHPKDPAFLHLAGPLLRNYHQKDLLLAGKMCPADGRIQNFLEAYLDGFAVAKLPANTLVLDRPGLARAMSLPAG